MWAIGPRVEIDEPTEGLLRPAVDVTPWRTVSPANAADDLNCTAIGPQAHRAFHPWARITRLAGTRLRRHGLSFVLLAVGLGFAAWSDRVNFSSDDALAVAPAAHASDERPVVSRFAYANTAAFRKSLKRRAAQRALENGAASARRESDSGDQPVLSLVSFVSPEYLHAAPIRSPEAQQRERNAASQYVGILPAKREDVLNSPPEPLPPSPAPEAQGEAVLPEPVAVAAIAPVSEEIAIEEPDVSIVKSRRHKRAPKRKAVSSNARGAARAKAGAGTKTRAKAKAKSKAAKVANVPRWAEKMFIQPWQTRAFGYQ